MDSHRRNYQFWDNQKNQKNQKSTDYRSITADQNQFTKSDGIMQSSIEMDNVWAIKVEPHWDNILMPFHLP